MNISLVKTAATRGLRSEYYQYPTLILYLKEVENCRSVMKNEITQVHALQYCIMITTRLNAAG